MIVQYNCTVLNEPHTTQYILHNICKTRYCKMPGQLLYGVACLCHSVLQRKAMTTRVKIRSIKIDLSISIGGFLWSHDSKGKFSIFHNYIYFTPLKTTSIPYDTTKKNIPLALSLFSLVLQVVHS